MKRSSVKVTKKKKENRLNYRIILFISELGESFYVFLQIWKDTLDSNLPNKEKAEILRLLIFAITFIILTALFVLNRF